MLTLLLAGLAFWAGCTPAERSLRLVPRASANIDPQVAVFALG